jgi:hypothetical protein
MTNLATIDVRKNESPQVGDIIFASIDEGGTPGQLNLYVLNELKIGQSTLPIRRRLIKGFDIYENKKTIIYVVTVGQKSTRKALSENFEKACNEYLSKFNGKTIWVPLMGTGAGGLTFRESFEIIYHILLEVATLSPSANIIISVPSEVAKTDFDHFNDLISRKIVPHSGDFSALITNVFTDSNRQLFVAGFHWNSTENKLKEFDVENKWENGHYKQFTEIVNEVEIGDVILAKTSWARKKEGVLSIYGVGVVNGNHRDGHILDVKWRMFPTRIDVGDATHYRGAIHKVTQPDHMFQKVLKEIPDLYEIISQLDESYRSESRGQLYENDNISGLIRAKLNGTSSVWWLQSNPKKWKVESYQVNSIQEYSTHNAGKNPRRIFDFFFQVQVGEILIIYESSPSRCIKGLAEVTKPAENRMGDVMKFRILCFFEKQTTWNQLLEIEGFKATSIAQNNQGSLFQIDKEVAEVIINTTEFKPNIDRTNRDKIPFHYDRVVDNDELGREPAAIAFTDLIKDDIFTQNLDHAFMVHLQGEWGAGKSTFLNLIKKHLNTGDKKWVIVNYNAWKNQHLSPPWWTFLDQIYQQTKTDKNFSEKKILSKRELFRRVKYYSAWQKILAFALTIVFMGLILIFGNEILNFLVNLFSSEKIDGETKGLTVDVFAKLIVSIGALVGLIYSLSKFLSTPFFMTGGKDASLFMERTADPLKRIKDHFKYLVSDINNKHQLAIFIDDIDRCDRTFLVQLLEGIQTLFKGEKVLYLVAGDKQWISKAFQNQYKEFDTERKDDQNNLGDLFIRKAFQLSIRMPQVSEAKKKGFWDYILGASNSSNETSRSIDELDYKEKQEFEKEMASVSDEEIAKPEVLERIERKFKVSADEVSNRAIKRKNASGKELKHLLRDYHSLLDANPRSIIRLANFYTMTRSTLIAERRDPRPNLLFRWLILKEIYPSSLQLISEVNTMKGFRAKLDGSDLSAALKEKCKLLISGEKGQNELTIEIVKELEGL